MIKTNGMKLMECINELEEIESIDTKLTFAIFRSSAYSQMEKKVDDLKNRIQNQMQSYNIKEELVEEKNKELIEKYKAELRKIYVEYENSIINIQLEMQEAESNQKIAIANLKKIADTKKEAMDKPEYLEELMKNPNIPQMYAKREDAYLKKFNDYNTIIDECLIETELCRQELLKTLDEVDIIGENNQIAKKGGIIQDIINKIKSIFNSKSAYESGFVNNIEEKLSLLENENAGRIKEVSRKNVKFLATIIVMRKKINQYFKLETERG